MSLRKMRYPLTGSSFNASSFNSSTSGTDDTLRIAIMGAPAVGKTALIHQFVYQRFLRSYSATIQERFITALETDGREIVLEIFDTPGAYCFSNVRKLAITNADAFVLVYDVGDESSLERLIGFRDLIVSEKKSGVPVIVVGNKTDNEDAVRFISEAKARCLVTAGWDHTYLETSAVDTDSVKSVFRETIYQTRLFIGQKKKRFRLPSFFRAINQKLKKLTAN